METDLIPALDRLRAQLRQFPAPVLEEFEKALTVMPATMTSTQIPVWAGAGVGIANQTVRSWEAAAQFYRASPKVFVHMPFNHFVAWIDCGGSLCRESPTLATAYFEASPGTVGVLRPRYVEGWSNLGRSLSKGTWKSNSLACKFFAASPWLLESLSFSELERFVAFLDALSHRSHELSTECLALAQQVFPLLGDDKGAFISLASTLVETGWREVKSFFEASAGALPKIRADQRLHCLGIARRLVEAGWTNIPTVMLDVSESLVRVDPENHARILTLAESLLDVAPAAVPEFVRACPKVLERITIDQLDRWFDEGVRILKQNRDAGLAYFMVQSLHTERVLEGLSSGVEFGWVKDVMEMYCQALAGKQVKLSDTEDLVSKNIGWVSSESPSTEGSTVFVPSLVDRYSTKEENFAWFKVISTHQVAHIEFGSFRFEFGKTSALFRDMRSKVESDKEKGNSEAVGSPGKDITGVERDWVTDMQRFFNLFEDRGLSLDIFTVVEDGRLDTLVKLEYPGLRRAYTGVQQDSLAERPDIESLPLREAMVEFIVRLSLEQTTIPAPKRYVNEARSIARIIKRVLVPEATVEDVAEATLRIYAIISHIPNEEAPPEEWETVDVTDEEEYVDSNFMQELLQQLAQGTEMEERSDQEEEYESTREVEFRGDFKPELVQLLSRLRMQHQDEGGETQGVPITQEQLQELLRNSAELNLQALQGKAANSSELFADNILRETGASLPQSQEFKQGPLIHVEEEAGSLEPTEPQTFVYDEWDFRAEDYKPRWCIVRQKTMGEGDQSYFGRTLHNYGSMAAQVRRQFEMMVPEMLRKVRRLDDGDEIDIDDLIEALVDIRTGVSPSDKFYWRRNKVKRDVAVAFLLDTSASTAEAIDEAKRTADDWEAPDDPVEYMSWLRSRRGEAIRRSYKRIIDVEKEAIVLLVNALEAIGDIYGIYGFSGYGRENVEFYIIKDLDERLLREGQGTN